MIYYTVLERYQENPLELMVANDKIAHVTVANNNYTAKQKKLQNN